MEYDSKFIDFCDDEEQEDILYYYLRYLLNIPLQASYWAFDKLYDSYIDKYLIEKTEKHYNLCKFYAFEYFYDLAISNNCYGDRLKNNDFF